MTTNCKILFSGWLAFHYAIRLERKKASVKAWTVKNAVRIAAQKHQIFLENRDAILAAKRKYALQPHVIARKNAQNAIRRKNNPEKHRNYVRKWQKLHAWKRRAKKNEYNRNRRANDPFHRFECRVRIAIHKRMGGCGSRKTESMIAMIGCSTEDFRNHLESQFKDGMNWSNRGLKGWHIDHVIPLRCFDFTKSEHRLAAFHYSNTRPVWAEENLRKGHSVDVQLVSDWIPNFKNSTLLFVAKTLTTPVCLK